MWSERASTARAFWPSQREALERALILPPLRWKVFTGGFWSLVIGVVFPIIPYWVYGYVANRALLIEHDAQATYWAAGLAVVSLGVIGWASSASCCPML